jgi:hypothetical protein
MYSVTSIAKTCSVRFKVLTAASMTMIAFWDIAPCSTVEVDRRFRGVSCRHQKVTMEAVRTSETSVYFNGTTRRYIPEGYHL